MAGSDDNYIWHELFPIAHVAVTRLRDTYAVQRALLQAGMCAQLIDRRASSRAVRADTRTPLCECRAKREDRDTGQVAVVQNRRSISRQCVVEHSVGAHHDRYASLFTKATGGKYTLCPCAR